MLLLFLARVASHAFKLNPQTVAGYFRMGSEVVIVLGRRCCLLGRFPNGPWKSSYAVSKVADGS